MTVTDHPATSSPLYRLVAPASHRDTTQADLVRLAVQVQAAAKAVNAAKRHLYAAGFGPHIDHAAAQGVRFNVPVPGYGTAFVPGGNRILETTDEPALASWLEVNHADRFVIRTYRVEVADQEDAADALDRMEAAECNPDERYVLQTVYAAAQQLAGALRLHRDVTVDLAAMAKEWKRRTPEHPDDRDHTGLPVDPDGRPVPHVRWTTTPFGQLTVRPDKVHVEALAARYMVALGVPLAELPREAPPQPQ